MKKKQKTISLKKVNISKLQNPHIIYGGSNNCAGDGTGNGTDGGQGGGQDPDCLTGSDVYKQSTHCPDNQ